MSCSAKKGLKRRMLWKETGFVSKELREILFTSVLQSVLLIFLTIGPFKGQENASRPSEEQPQNQEAAASNAEMLPNTWPCVAIQSSGWWKHLPLGQAGIFVLDISSTSMAYVRFRTGEEKR